MLRFLRARFAHEIFVEATRKCSGVKCKSRVWSQSDTKTWSHDRLQVHNSTLYGGECTSVIGFSDSAFNRSCGYLRTEWMEKAGRVSGCVCFIFFPIPNAIDYQNRTKEAMPKRMPLWLLYSGDIQVSSVWTSSHWMPLFPRAISGLRWHGWWG